MSDKPEILACVLIPVVDGTLLLPNVSIAEIVDFTQPESLVDAPPWLLGHLAWRGIRLPVISYEKANGAETVSQNSRQRIVVLNTIGTTHDAQPFLALVIQDIPRQAKLNEADVTRRDEPTGPADLMVVEFEGEPVRIPNLEHLEKLAAEHRVSS